MENAFGKFVWKIKRKRILFLFSPSFLVFGPRVFFSWQPLAQLPSPFSPLGPAAAPGNRPRPRAQPLTARACLWAPSSPPRDSATARACAWATAAAPGLLASWERPSPRLASLNQSPHPSRRPAAPLHSVFALASEFVITARRSFADAVRRLLSRSDRRRRALPSPFFPAVSAPRPPSSSPSSLFLVLLAS